MRTFRRVLVLLLILGALPFLALQAIYRWSLHRVEQLLHLSTPARVLPVHRALWAAEEPGPMRVAPRWPWTVLRRERPPGAGLEAGVARRLVRSRVGIARVLEELSVMIWLSQHASAAQLTELVRRTPMPWAGPLGERAQRTPEQLTWGEAALVGALWREPSVRCHPVRAWQARRTVLLHLLSVAAIRSSEFDAADLEPLPVFPCHPEGVQCLEASCVQSTELP